METFLERLSNLLDPSVTALVSVIDILLVAYVVYRLLKLVRGRRAWRVVLGIGVFALALAGSEKLGLRTLHWILDKATILAPVALVILFLPELRQAIEGFARVGSWSGKWMGREGTMALATIDEFVKASTEMAQTSTGALLVIERNNKLDDVAGNGVPVRAVVTAPLLGAIFYEGNPLHDGAVIVREGEVLAAACRLPLSESSRIGDKYHMRHRAGIGISEQSDAVVLIVSEERGSISLAIDGHLEMIQNTENLRTRLIEELSGDSSKRKSSSEVVQRAKNIKESTKNK